MGNDTLNWKQGNTDSDYNLSSSDYYTLEKSFYTYVCFYIMYIRTYKYMYMFVYSYIHICEVIDK